MRTQAPFYNRYCRSSVQGGRDYISQLFPDFYQVSSIKFLGNYAVMTVRRKYTEKDTIYYTTFTCHHWNSYIQIADAWNAVYKGFDDMKKLYGVLLTGYVIMPNHLHSMLYVPEKSPDINMLISDQKRFLAYAIVDQLEVQSHFALLQKMEADLTDEERAKKQKHKVFKGRSDIKECYSEWFIRQKLDYMHHNPVCGKWNLVEEFTKYPHSSAGFYERNEQGIYEVVNYKDVWKMCKD